MLRSAAKNHDSVTVVVDPLDYAEVADQIKSAGNTRLELRRQLAAKVFARTAAYDAAIATHLAGVFGTNKSSMPGGTFPNVISIRSKKAQSLRYGENPHQKAALYVGPILHFFVVLLPQLLLRHYILLQSGKIIL